jgi:hypothetical protein
MPHCGHSEHPQNQLGWMVSGDPGLAGVRARAIQDQRSTSGYQFRGARFVLVKQN